MPLYLRNHNFVNELNVYGVNLDYISCLKYIKQDGVTIFYI